MSHDEGPSFGERYGAAYNARRARLALARDAWDAAFLRGDTAECDRIETDNPGLFGGEDE